MDKIISARVFGKKVFYQIVEVCNGFVKYKKLTKNTLNSFENNFVFKANINRDGSIQINSNIIGYIL